MNFVQVFGIETIDDNENWRERDKVYEEMPDAILRILFRRC